MAKLNFRPDFSKSLKKKFYLNDTETLAKLLVGKVLVKRTRKGTLAARIVETEAYLSEGDLSSHSAQGLTKRNAPMFESGGILYVYKIYGIHRCLNIVAGKKGAGCAVLLRAAEPLSGHEIMAENRGIDDPAKLCRGPGNLAKAFGFDVDDNFRSLDTPELFIQDETGAGPPELLVSRRIGIKKSAGMMLRFFEIGSKYVSASKKGSSINNISPSQGMG